MLSVFSGRGSFILLIKKLRYVLALLVLSVLQQECTVSIQIKISVGSWLAFAGFANSLRYRVLSGAVEFPKEDVQGVTDSSRHSDKRAAPGRALLCCVSVCACLRRNGPVSGGFGGLSPGLVAAAAAAVPAAELGCARCAARGYRSALRNRSGASPPRAGVERKGLRAAVAAREARGVWPLELPRQRFRRQRAPGSTGGAGPAAAPAGGGAAMAAAGPGGRDAAASGRGQKTKLSRHARELRAAAALQGAAPWAWRGRAGALAPPVVPQQRRLRVPQSKGGRFSRSRARKSSVGTGSGSPACARPCRKMPRLWTRPAR